MLHVVIDMLHGIDDKLFHVACCSHSAFVLDSSQLEYTSELAEKGNGYKYFLSLN